MSEVKNRGWQVTMAGLGINLALGILYTWSIFKLAIKASIEAGDGRFDWSLAQLNDPYAVCCMVFAFGMIMAGRIQDRMGPRATATIGGVLTGAGLILAASSPSITMWILGFGVLMGLGLGFGYASATPPAIKWFPAAKTGMIAGIVVSGFGLASVYIAPLAHYLIGRFGLETSMMIFGVAFLLVVSVLAQLLVNPPAGFKPAGSAPVSAKAPSAAALVDYHPSEIIKTRTFYVLWIAFAIGSGAGLMIIGNVAGMAQSAMGDMAWVVVALMAVGNAGGRIAAGMLSDKLGRMQTMAIMMTFQALIMFSLLLIGKDQAVLIVAAATFVGFNYGTNLSLFPSATKDYFGLKNFGINYGLVFTSWGVGGFILPRVSQMIVAATGTYDTAYILAGSMLIGVAGLTTLAGRPVKVEETVPAGAAAATIKVKS